MRLSHTLQYFGLICFARIICFLPRGWAFGIGSAIGSFGWAVGMRNKLVLSNISHAKPDATQDELEQIGKQAAKNFGRTITEFVRYGIKERDLLRETIKIQDLDLVREALAKGNGAILLTGHHGAWALYFAAIAMDGVPLSLLVGKQHNPKVDTFIHKIPGDRVELISKGRTAIKAILEKLRAGRAVVMVADQHAGPGGLVIPFLGKNASTLPLPGSIAAKYDVPVFIMSGHRNPDGTHQVEIAPIIVPESEAPDQKKTSIMLAYNKALGEIVANRPEQYFWYHRRWREEDEARSS